jgi:hypothetical protein
MNETQPSVRFEGGLGESVRLDSVNGHGQRCLGTLGVPGTHKNAVVYKLECNLCGFVYGANSGDVHERKCPNCQGGAPGLRFWLIARKVPVDANGGPQQTRVEYDIEETAADWIERISGSFKDDPGFEEMVRLGREFRQADRPHDDPES